MGRPGITKETDQDIRKRLKAGQKPTQISKDLKVSLTTIYKIRSQLAALSEAKQEVVKRAEKMAQELEKKGRNSTEILEEVFKATGIKLVLHFKQKGGDDK